MDIMAIGPLNTSGSGWLISSPTAFTFPKMPLDTETSKRSLRAHHRRTKATQITTLNGLHCANSLHRQVSLSSMSVPGLTNDHHSPSGSWACSEAFSVEDDVRTLDLEPNSFPGDIWSKREPLSSHPADDPNLSSCNRNFGTTNLSILSIIEKSQTTTPVRTESSSPSSSRTSSPSRSPPRRPKLKTQRSYLAFPPMPSHQYKEVLNNPPSRQHQSWEPSSQVERPPLRARAHTTHSNTNHHTNRPSNLSTCTTLDAYSESYASISSTSTHLYMHPTSSSHTPTTPLTPLTPHFPQTQTPSCDPLNHLYPNEHPALTDYLSQQSYFFHDDEDGTQEASWFETQKRKWLKQALPKSPEQKVEMVRAREVYYGDGGRECGGGEREKGLGGVLRGRKKNTLGLGFLFKRGEKGS